MREVTARDDAARHLRPDTMVALAMTVDSAAFVEAISVPLLLVRIDEPASELATTLERVFESGGARVEPALGFHTVTQDSAERVGSVRPAPPSFGPQQLQVRLIRALHFAVPLRKRAGGKSFTERISIGRARNNDVVLRHESVSKFHAWIGRDEDDAYYVADGGSRNGTKWNGGRVSPGAPVRLEPGDLVQFGAIEAIFCGASVVWGALNR
jgi:hypothetical protein